MNSESDDYISANSTNNDLNPNTSYYERRKETLNHLFGFKPWKHHITKRSIEERSDAVKSLYVEDRKTISSSSTWRLIGNLFWSVFFGWWLSLLYLVAAVVLTITIVGFPYAKWCILMSKYILWPFNKFLVTQIVETQSGKYSETSNLIGTKSTTGIIGIIGRIIWYIVSFFTVLPAHLIAALVTWEFIFTIPMAKANFNIIKNIILKNPLAIEIVSYPDVSYSIKQATMRAANIYYYKYNVFGMNIMLVNLLPFVVFSIVEGWLVPDDSPYALPSYALFIMDILAIIPLAYYIGMGISSFAAQSNYMFGAVLSASFGSIIEIILYISAIISSDGKLNNMVLFAFIGSLLASLLLLPGISMLIGGLKHKSQNFNPEGAGVSSTLLMISLTGIFIPTLFYQIYGDYEFNCSHCYATNINDTVFNISAYNLQCLTCNRTQHEIYEDPHYLQMAKPLSLIIAVLLPLSYFVGLIFTLRTHSHIYDDYEERHHEEQGGHDAPEWNKFVALSVLLVATTLFALIAENLVQEIEPTIEAIGISEDFLGLTLIALIPNIAEFFNAIHFSLQNNVSLAMEIGEAAAIQVALIQVPVLIIFGATFGQTLSSPFALIFPSITVFAVIFAVIIINYISIDGKSNYFQGFSMVIVYIIFVAAFYFMPQDV